MKKYLASIFFQHLAFGFTIPILLIWQSQKGLSFAEIGFIQSFGMVTGFLCDIPSSYFADRFGKKPQLLAGLLFLCGSFSWLFIAQSFGQFFTAVIMQNIGFALLSGTEESFLHDLYGQGSTGFTKALSRMSIADELGTMLGLGLSSVLGWILGIPATFAVGLLSLCISLVLVLMIRVREAKTTTEEHAMQLKQFLNVPRMAILLACSLLLFNAFTSERGELVFQVMLKQTGWQMGTFGLIYLLAKFFSVLGSLVSHRIENILGIKNTLCIVLLLQCLAFGALSLFGRFGVILSLCTFFFSENVLRNVRSSYILRSVPSSLKTTALSVVALSTSLALSVTQATIGLLMSHTVVLAIVFLVVIKALCLLWIVSYENLSGSEKKVKIVR